MRYIRGLVLALALLLFLLPTVRAADLPALDELERSAGEYAPDMSLDEGIDLNKGLQDLMDTGTAQVGGVLRTALKSGVLLLVIVLFCSLAEGAADQGSKILQAAPIAGVLAVCAVAVHDVHSLMGLGREAIARMADFAAVLLPTLAAAAAAGGTPAGAAARQMATVLFSNLLTQLITKLLIPLTYAYVAASAVHAAVGNPGLKRIAATLKGVVVGALTTIMLAFTGYLSISAVIAGTTDAITVKTAKFAISGMVPVVGGVLSDAAETVIVSAGILRNAVGIFGTLVILGACLAPFLRMGVHYLVYKFTAALASTVWEGRVTGLIDAIGGAFALELGMTACCAMMLLFCVISCLSAAGAV